MAEVNSTLALGLGSRAPDFQLPDGRARFFRFCDLEGPEGTLVIFCCNHCPFVVHLAEAIGHFAREIKERGVSTVAINSNDVANFPADCPELMVSFAEKSGWDFPYLFDEDQEVAKAYRAACTPDFFLFGQDRKLVYAGQFDASRPRNDKPITGADLRAAVEAMILGEDPAAPQLPSSGCNIKWKPGNEPLPTPLPSS